MSKSIDDILRQQAAQRQVQAQQQQAKERAIYEQRERARLEYIQKMKMYEAVASVNPIGSSAIGSGAGAGGSLITQFFTDTILLFPQIDADWTYEEHVSGTFSYNKLNGDYEFKSLADLITFYDLTNYDGDQVLVGMLPSNNFVILVDHVV